jgi:hypothetical protein
MESEPLASIKHRLMLKVKQWDEREIEEHGKEMKNVLLQA